MKRSFILASLLVLIFTGISFAQAPQGIKYQAVARNASGNILSNQNISLRIAILDSASGGTIVYTESHKTSTNQFGLFSVTVGDGVVLQGDFSTIPWATAEKWMQVEMDPLGGSNFTLLGATELQSVPYALFASQAGGSAVLDTSQTNETITDVSFDPVTNILTVEEAGQTYTTTIEYAADDLSDNFLNDLGDVNTTPNNDQVLKWNGVEWVAADDETNDQTLAIINNLLSITDGNSVDLSPYLDNTDEQQLSYDTATNVLSLQNGGAVDLTDLTSDAYNQGISFDPVTDELTITDGGGSVTTDLSDLTDDADADPTNEYVQSFNFDPATKILTITDGGNSFDVDLTALVNSAYNTGLTFNGSTNELTITDDGTSYTVDLTTLTSNGYNTAFSFDQVNYELTIDDNGSTYTVDLTALKDDADADPANEVISNVTFDPGTNEMTISEAGTQHVVNLAQLAGNAYNTGLNFDPVTNTLTITDAGTSYDVNLSDLSTDAYNTNFDFDVTTNELTITDDGGDITVDLTDLINDADSDPVNEIQSLSFNNNILSLSGSSQTVDLSALTGTDNQSLSSTINGTNVTVDITNGSGTTFSIEDNDSDPANEIQNISLSGNILQLDQSGGTVNLGAYLDNTDNQTLNFSGGTLTISNGNSVSIPDNVNDADSDPTNEYNTNVALSGNTLQITDGGGTQSVNLSSLNTNDGDWVFSGNDIKHTSGNVYIGNTSSSGNDLYLADNIVDWDNSSYFMDMSAGYSGRINGEMDIAYNQNALYLRWNAGPPTYTICNDCCSFDLFDWSCGTFSEQHYNDCGQCGSTTYHYLGLEINGAGRASAWFTTSDERVKTNIGQIPDALNTIKSLTGYTYDYDWSAQGGTEATADDGKMRGAIGFLAQELKDVLPQAVQEIDPRDGEKGSEGYQNQEIYAVNYDALIPVLVEAIKDQQKQIDELKAKLGSEDETK